MGCVVLGRCGACWGCGGDHNGSACVGAWGVYNEGCPVEKMKASQRGWRREVPRRGTGS